MTLETQFVTMFTMIAFGVYIGIAYVTFKRLELWWANLIFLRYLCELFFWVVQAAFLFFVLYIINEGIVRFYILLALLCGYAMFKALFEHFYRKALEVILEYVTSFVRFIVRCIKLLLVNPVVWIISIVFLSLYRILLLLLKLLRFLLMTILFPFRHIFKLILRLVPENGKKYIYHICSFFSKIKKKRNKSSARR
ncbi:spore cortex biosynthesis protein YabQ [Gracilibacillus oryzae]|uniref:Spore cortex biosynthesis protein YabQ n=1 Tax=Gracilibacillus oryzae TaxID=1672701 RepID=A0A7C8KMN7_9BACI|nr:spore cortex biosynthesis protein YabQ [Gracilibacillus oryzae]